MLKFEMSYHAKEERAERLAAVVEKIGVGQVILEVQDPHDKAIKILTSTGLLLIKDKTSNLLITGYMANINQLFAIYGLAGVNKIPPKILTRVKKNVHFYSYLLTM